MFLMISRRRALALLAVAGTASLAGCGAAGDSAAETLDAAGFKALVAKPGVVVLDVRTPEEFAAGHLENAVNIDINGADFATKVAALDKSATYAVYCRSGNRSATALAAMKKAGIAKVQHLGGGIGAWQSAGNKLVK